MKINIELPEQDDIDLFNEILNTRKTLTDQDIKNKDSLEKLRRFGAIALDKFGNIVILKNKITPIVEFDSL